MKNGTPAPRSEQPRQADPAPKNGERYLNSYCQREFFPKIGWRRLMADRDAYSSMFGVLLIIALVVIGLAVSSKGCRASGSSTGTW